ncbi:MAG: diguanylate cyclase, partial [Proteobacteria bacterium]|nr:diguanylate cyclase [Pseudomonadota bacterium]
LAGANAETAREFAERLSWKIADTTVSYEGRDLAVTVSIGIAVMQADDENADRALLRADAALYRAKEAGRDRVEVIA